MSAISRQRHKMTELVYPKGIFDVFCDYNQFQRNKKRRNIQDAEGKSKDAGLRMRSIQTSKSNTTSKVSRLSKTRTGNLLRILALLR